MHGSSAVLRDSHRADVERLLESAVAEEVHRSKGRMDAAVLLARARAALEELTAAAAEEYGAYVRAVDEAAAARRPLGELFSRRALSTPALVTGVAALAALGADLGHGSSPGTAVAVGATVAAAGAVATVVKLAAEQWPAAHRSAGLRGQPGGPEQLKLQWLTALEVRGIRPFLDRQYMVAAATRRTAGAAAAPPGADTGERTGGPLPRGGRSAAARRRAALERSFDHVPEVTGPFAGRREHLERIAQWVRAGRADPETKPTVVVLHGPPGAGRSTLALRAAHHLRDQFRGACVVDLRGGTVGQGPLSTRDALMHLLNRLGAPREQLLFRERSAPQQHIKRLSELYHQHVTNLPVTIVLEDVTDPAQVRVLLPERSDSLLLVTAREPLELPPDLPARVHRLAVGPLDRVGAEELLDDAVREPDDGLGPREAPARPMAGDPESSERVRELCGGLPLALRIAGSWLAAAPGRTPRDLADALVDRAAADGGAEPVELALGLRCADLPEPGRRLLRRLSLAGRAGVGAAAAAALLAVDERTADRELAALARSGLIQRERGSRYRLHEAVRVFAHVLLCAEDRPADRSAAQERLIRSYAELADSVIRLVDGKTSTRADRAWRAVAIGPHGFASLDAALRWLDDESASITAALRHAEGVDQSAVLHLLGALCDYCLLRGDLYRLGEISELAQAVDQGLLRRSVQWRTGIAARQLGELDKARTTLASVVDLYYEAQHPAGAARALCSLGITLHHQGNLPEAAAKLREALEVQSAEELRADRAWTEHALAAVERDRGHIAPALALLRSALEGHRESESLHGQAWAHFQLGQVRLRMGRVPDAEAELRAALELYGRTRDVRGEAWALTELARARLVAGDAGPAEDRLGQALTRHRENEDARGEAWTLYYLGQALEERGDRDAAIRALERARTMFSRMRDVYGLACARHHSARVTRDLRGERTGNLRNSGFARQLLQDARQDFHRVGVAHGEAWSCVELAVIDGGNGRETQALALVDEAARLFDGYGDRRGGDWARLLRCTLLPFASPGGSVVGAAVAQEELAALLAESHPHRDALLTECGEAFALVLERGVEPESGWQAWRLGMVPNRHSREVMGVPVREPSADR
ncbi:tetratricopeptide repeat protein [Streptomyces sp. URMC 123]|uniref:tetratricopeptide repeat protein n=1 Tax=Streptomyces sp. URMC 123 TaxID=3423403 RepID=UPI003F1C624C